MRLGVTSFIYRYAIGTAEYPAAVSLGPVGVLRRAAAVGLEVVQFCENLPLHALTPEALGRLLREAKALGLALELGTRGTDVAQLLGQLDLAVKLGSGGLRLVLGTADPRQAEEALRAVLPRCHQLGIRLAVENHADLPGPVLADLLGRLSDPLLGTCIDCANSLGLLERPEETVAALAPFAVQLHLKDYAVEKAPIGYHITGRRLGQGWLDLKMVWRCIADAGRRPDVYLEQWMPPLDQSEATLAEEERWIADGVRVARRWMQGDTAR